MCLRKTAKRGGGKNQYRVTEADPKSGLREEGSKKGGGGMSQGNARPLNKNGMKDVRISVGEVIKKEGKKNEGRKG